MKILVIGLGSIGQKHVKVLQEMEDKEIDIYALRSGTSAITVPGVTDIASINDPDMQFDFIIVANPTFAHHKTLEQLLASRVPLFIEKPLFHTLQYARPLVEQYLEANVKTYIACNLRFHPCILYLKEMLATGREQINEVNVYAGSYLPEWRPGANFRNVYSANAAMGGGVHLDLIHELDYIYWLFGKPVSVRATLTQKSSLALAAIDYANYLLEYDGFNVNIILNYYRRRSKRTCEIVFDDRTVVADIVGQQVWEDDKQLFSANVDTLYTYREQMKYYLACLEKDDKPMNDIESAFEVLKICLDNE